MARERIAVIGAGISGLASAWLLSRQYDVTVFEKNDYIGGHTNTVDVPGDQGPRGVDTGFMVFNHRNYPHLKALFAHLGIESQPTDMSFSASVGGGRLEYAGSDLNTLFAQRRNLFNPRFLRMLRDIIRFNRTGKALLQSGDVPQVTLGGYLIQERYGPGFRDDYLLPMAAAIWSCPTHRMLDFPLESFLNFFSNHGLLDLADRPQWHTVKGGSREYVRQMLKALPDGVHANRRVVAVQRQEGQIRVITDDQGEHLFDQVVFGCHADEVLGMLEDPTEAESRILQCFTYQPNRTLLHTDVRLMPRMKRVWSSWNYMARQRSADAPANAVSVTYWMNRLQALDESKDYLVSLNPLIEPREETIIREIRYHHPVFDQRAMEAQKQLPELQGADRIWFCGAWTGYGFHEDGLRSAIQVAGRLGVSPPWSIPREATGDEAAQPAGAVGTEAS
ncbi:NAD(P)/FAD-dependent oxidoreductase [Ectothiorhodospira sp. BSL-9]|uniref:NAD(P)/FAD-dependent oxidoreductase n=1 Tax=Ectothiorhodospira sp. BSL-9 TaxID=1442136 RepID=UPI0007B44144|nr:FAD-dependent oxidoreductase [Ectothiorhodospira sp. BSL-9]ANB01088.1 NADH-ubiquinone oxidoreductase subunit 6 [Ectothiorhodospira sp. BSL-9]TVQ72153.1 MAG: FAD-dependent oxidoreductase [Chromatiaceae bacterium]